MVSLEDVDFGGVGGWLLFLGEFLLGVFSVEDVFLEFFFLLYFFLV